MRLPFVLYKTSIRSENVAASGWLHTSRHAGEQVHQKLTAPQLPWRRSS
jgi:hypothetical protein